MFFAKLRDSSPTQLSAIELMLDVKLEVFKRIGDMIFKFERENDALRVAYLASGMGMTSWFYKSEEELNRGLSAKRVKPARKKKVS